jgi:bifunctional DNA-binding transcriptional regulator/antitoxin component of YhaV-PrlF toxin-antitoxin module
MSQRVEVELDDQGRLVIPHLLQQQLGLFSGATVVVEDETPEVAFVRVHPAQPRLVEKGGVLVVQAQPLRDLTNSVHDERERRMEDLLWQVQS